MSLSRPRRLIDDLMWVCRRTPLVTFKRRMDLAPIHVARERLATKPSWTVLFFKAYAVLAVRRAELRRLFIPFPRRSLYEHPESIGRIAVERFVDGEPAVLAGRIIAPELMAITDLDTRLKHFAEAPLAEVRSFGRMLQIAALPRPLRRILWLSVLHSTADRRARTLGTFAVSMTGSMNAYAVHLRSPCAVTLHCGPLDDRGSVDMFMTFDHRVLDGAPAARALAELEETLNGPILDEISGMPRLRDA